MYLFTWSKGVWVSRGSRVGATPERASGAKRGGLVFCAPKRRVSRAWSLGAPFVAPNLEHVASKLAL